MKSYRSTILGVLIVISSIFSLFFLRNFLNGFSFGLFNLNNNIKLTELKQFTAKSVKNKDIFNKEKSILISNFDGSKPKFLIKSQNSNHFLDYLGYSNDGQVIYYAEYFAGEKNISVFRKNLSDQEIIKIFKFETTIVEHNNFYEFIDSVNISPDKKFLAFRSYGSIYLYDIGKESTKKLLSKYTFSDCDYPHNGCYHYSDPQWSPDGKHLILTKVHYDLGHNVIINPFIDETSEILETEHMDNSFLKDRNILISYGICWAGMCDDFDLIDLNNNLKKTKIDHTINEFFKDKSMDLIFGYKDNQIIVVYKDDSSGYSKGNSLFKKVGFALYDFKKNTVDVLYETETIDHGASDGLAPIRISSDKSYLFFSVLRDIQDYQEIYTHHRLNLEDLSIKEVKSILK
jgi:hypothetical protein